LTWAHERVDESALDGKSFGRLDSIRELSAWLAQR
jgi:hypothetical protein